MQKNERTKRIGREIERLMRKNTESDFRRPIDRPADQQEDAESPPEVGRERKKEKKNLKEFDDDLICPTEVRAHHVVVVLIYYSAFMTPSRCSIYHSRKHNSECTTIHHRRPTRKNR